MNERLTLICGSDCPVVDSFDGHLLGQFIEKIKQTSNSPSDRLRTQCFSPAPYGTDAIVQSVDEHPFANYTLPGPSIPIPRGADFLGLHVNQVEADVHLPLPDANRTFQMRQQIRSLQRSGSPLMLLSLHPGVIGNHVRREGIKRRARGKAIPLVAVHWSGYCSFSEQRVSEILEAIVKKHGPTLHDLLTKELAKELGSQLAAQPAHARDERRSLNERLLALTALAQQVALHWYIIPNREHFNVRWGKFWLWWANFVSAHARHRLQGSLALAQLLEEQLELIESLLGVPLSELLKRPANVRDLALQVGVESVGWLVGRYHRWFYSECDRIINLEGQQGLAELLNLGIESKSIFNFDLAKDATQQLQGLYHDIVTSSTTRIAPKRTRLAEFQWSSRETRFPKTSAHLAISDVHLGDGSGTERALATLALRDHCQSLSVRSLEIVGDLIQRDVPKELAEKHRTSFLRALKHVTGTILGDQSTMMLSIQANAEAALSSKQQAEIVRELQSCAIKLGCVIDYANQKLGVPDSTYGDPIGVYVERGNHDEGEKLEEVVPGATVSESMIRFDRDSGVLFCHGNIWNLPEVARAMLDAKSLDDLSARLTESNLKGSLETAQVIYSLTSALWRATAKRIDVRGIWKNDLQPALSRLVQWQRQREEDADSQSSEFSRFMHGVISPVDNAKVAAQCGVLTQSFDEFCWAVCDGHSHRPSIEFAECPHPVSGRRSGVLLVNCGKFHGKNITAVFMRFPEAVLVEWDERDQCYYVLQHFQLSEEQIDLVLGHSQENSLPAPVLAQPVVDGPASARLLLEVCAEGNGHAERQLSFLPFYEQHAEVRIAASGSRGLRWADEQWPGHRIDYSPTGQVRYANTLFAYLANNRAIRKNSQQLLERLEHFTHAITDFGPNLSYVYQLAKKRGLHALPPLYHISHHAAMHSQFKDVPRPSDVDKAAFWATQRYLDSIVGDVNIGFHFEPYHSEIFTPPLADDMLQVLPRFDSDIVLVYLPGCPRHVAEQCALIDPNGEHEWHIYSSRLNQAERSHWPHVWLFPLDRSYREKLSQSRAILMSSGFMGPAEALHLGKPLIAIPTPGHGEHAFNAAALREITDVLVVSNLEDPADRVQIRATLNEAKSLNKPLQRYGRIGPIGPYADLRAAIVERVFNAKQLSPLRSQALPRNALSGGSRPQPTQQIPIRRQRQTQQ